MNDRQIIESVLADEIWGKEATAVFLNCGLRIDFNSDGNVCFIEASEGAEFITDFMHRLKAIAQTETTWEAI